MTWIKPSSNVAMENPLKGKRIGIIGSSSADVDRTVKNYWEYIAERTGVVLLNYADGGSTLTATTENYSAEETNQLKRIDELPTDGIDLIVIQPAANDDRSRPIGTFDSTSVTEIYGALHVMCKKMYDKYPTLPFGVMTSQYFVYKDLTTSPTHDAIKEVCAFYSVPLCDLKSEGRVPYSYPSWQTNYAPDGLHLNDIGNEVLSRRVEAFVRMLLGY